MAGAIGTAYVDVKLDPKQIGNQVNQAGSGLTSRFGGVGKKAGLAMVGGIGAAVGGAAVVGKLLYDVGGQFDDMSDTIRTSTGKSGDALKDLEDTAKTVATTIPASFADAGEAVSVINSRLGLTGKPLQDMSAQVLELSRLTGTDLPTALDATTRMLGDAGLKGADASKGIDEVFRASQATATPVDRLMGLMTKFGSPMRALGFSFEEQAALLGNFESQGVNTELVMGSMRKALGKLAKEGKDAPTALREAFDTIKNAKDPTKATAEAMELFGAKAGPDMAAAIREGRFEYGDLVDKIANGKDTVRKAGEDTNDLVENWLTFKNKVAVAVAPAATKLFGAVGEGMGFLSDKLPAVLEGLSGLGPMFDGIIEGIGPLGPLFESTFGELAATVQSLAPVFLSLFAEIGKIGAIIAPALGELVAAVQTALPPLAAAFGDIAIIIRELGPVWAFLASVIKANIQAIAKIVVPLVQIIAGVIRLIRQLIQGDWAGAWQTAQDIVQSFGDLLVGIVEGWLGIVKAITAPLRAAASAIGNAIKSGISSAISGIGGLVSSAMNAVRSAVTGVVGGITSAATAIGRAIWNGIMSVVSGLAGAVSGAMSAVGAAVSKVKGIVTRAVAGAASWLVATGRSIITGLANAISGAFGMVSGALSGLASTVMSAVSGAGSWLYGAGQQLVQGFINGMASMLGAVIAKAKSLVDSAVSAAKSAAKIFSPSKVMIEVGKDFGLGFAIGQDKAIPKVMETAAKMANAAVDASKERLSKAGDELANVLNKAYEVAGKQVRQKSAAELELAALEAGRSGAGGDKVLTETEKLLAERARLREQSERDQALADARAAVTTARSTKARAEAQKELDDLLYEQETLALEAKAEQERLALETATAAQATASETAYQTRKAQLEAQIALEQQHLDAEEWLRQQAYTKSIANLQAYMNSKSATQKGAQDRIAKLMQVFGISYAQIGAQMGTNFANAANRSAVAAAGATQNLQAVINAAIRNLQASVGAAGKNKKLGIARRAGVQGRAGTPVGGWAEAPPAPALPPAAFATGDLATGALVVNVSIGDTELRGIIQAEVLRGNQALAQALAAGGARV